MRAFTLIELIMTIIVVGIAAIPLSLSISQHAESVFYSQDLTTAISLARFEMEKVNNMGYTSIVSANPIYPGYNYDLTRIVTYAQGNDASSESLKKIIVTVTKSGSSEALGSLITYIAKNVSYGL